MLSRHYRQVLRRIERQMALEDPELDALLRTGLSPRRRLERLAFDLVAGASALSAALCLALSADGSAAAGFGAALFAGLTYWERRRRFQRPPPSSGAW